VTIALTTVAIALTVFPHSPLLANARLSIKRLHKRHWMWRLSPNQLIIHIKANSLCTYRHTLPVLEAAPATPRQTTSCSNRSPSTGHNSDFHNHKQTERFKQTSFCHQFLSDLQLMYPCACRLELQRDVLQVNVPFQCLGQCCRVHLDPVSLPQFASKVDV
jgi:hypothetical protein